MFQIIKLILILDKENPSKDKIVFKWGFKNLTAPLFKKRKKE